MAKVRLPVALQHGLPRFPVYMPLYLILFFHLKKNMSFCLKTTCFY
ncbi:hypothetical protein HMPREF9446_03981 [Bacteroides fluxus YIT 12057]|uniref:Uncharacterized protein n=1 Tax=Bacteroides fluxus YIT 12057 TaxID=763034 RepID=F3PYS5_9BACE|nr:hypothetical protein HMPREF9446_03981 [Bacteroides fluxus YIT 12057]